MRLKRKNKKKIKDVEWNSSCKEGMVENEDGDANVDADGGEK